MTHFPFPLLDVAEGHILPKYENNSILLYIQLFTISSIKLGYKIDINNVYTSNVWYLNWVIPFC